jgi:hypothetical protein
MEAKYYLISKLEWVNNNLNQEYIAYTINPQHKIYFYETYEKIYNNWMMNNRDQLIDGTLSVGVFFQEVMPVIYITTTTTTSVEGMDLTEITRI